MGLGPRYRPRYRELGADATLSTLNNAMMNVESQGEIQQRICPAQAAGPTKNQGLEEEQISVLGPRSY